MTPTNLQPLNDRIVVKPIKEEETTKSGIVLPDTVEGEKPEKGKVIAVGPGRQLDSGQRAEMPIYADDIVVFAKYSPTEIKMDGETYFILEEKDILAKLA
ncbi:co-chaperone GroES [Patescibacteria group bacterium]